MNRRSLDSQIGTDEGSAENSREPRRTSSLDMGASSRNIANRVTVPIRNMLGEGVDELLW